MLKNEILSLIASIAATLMPLPETSNCPHRCEISGNGVRLIQQFEGYSPFVYRDAAGLPTIGHGHLIRPGEKFQEPMLPADALSLLAADILRIEHSVKKLTSSKLKQPQYDAVVSFTFNLGAGAYQGSTLRKYVNAARHADVPDQFRRWVYVTNGGVRQKLKGLIVRREIEANLYGGGIL